MEKLYLDVKEALKYADTIKNPTTKEQLAIIVLAKAVKLLKGGMDEIDTMLKRGSR